MFFSFVAVWDMEDGGKPEEMCGDRGKYQRLVILFGVNSSHYR